MANLSLAAVTLAAVLSPPSVPITGPLHPTLQSIFDATVSPIVPVSPFDEVRVCESARTALRAGASGPDLPFDPAGEGFDSSGGNNFTIGSVYQTSDGWRCEVEQIIRDGRSSLEIRIYAPAQ